MLTPDQKFELHTLAIGFAVLGGWVLAIVAVVYISLFHPLV